MEHNPTQWKKIADITKRYPSHPFRTRIEDLGEGINVLQMKDVTEKGIVWHNVNRTEIKSNKPPVFLQKGDIFIVAKGAKNFAIVFENDHLVATDDTEPRLRFQTVCTPQFHHIRVNDSNQCNPYYLAFMLNQDYAQHRFDIGSVGTTTKNLRAETLENMTVPLPDIHIQNKLAALQRNISQQQAHYERLITNGHQLLQGLADQITKKQTH